MRRRRLVVSGTAAIAATTALTGCVGLGGPGGAGGGQVDVIGDMVLNTGLCRTGSPPCPGPGNSVNAGPTTVLQLLAAYQIADTIGSPDALTATYTGRPDSVTLTPSPSYTAELQRLEPAPAASRWVGYISPAFTHTAATDPATGTLAARFRLLPRPGGQPAKGFGYGITIGSRAADATAPATRDVNCGSSLTRLNADQGSDGLTICRDAVGGGGSSTRDLGVSAGSPETARPGELATVPFSLAYAGTAGPDVNFALQAGTTLPGADPAATPGSLAPAADSTTRVLVAVPVPGGARPGSYDVALTARLSNGQTRRAVGSLRIVGAGAGGTGGTGGTQVTTGGGPAGSARCAGVRATIVGTARRNVIRGTSKRDVIAALGGPVLVRGLGGDDLICLGGGADRGVGGAGKDRVLGEAGADQLDGGAGVDQLVGGGGNDTLRGGAGSDLLQAGNGPKDRAIGGAGRDNCVARRVLSC